VSELQTSLAKHDRGATERKYAVRYHKVDFCRHVLTLLHASLCIELVCALQIRFFERVKLERRVKQIEGKADRGHALSAEEQQHLKQHKENLQVIQYSAHSTPMRPMQSLARASNHVSAVCHALPKGREVCVYCQGSS